MNVEYTREEIKGLIEANRDGESLEELESRMAMEWLRRCHREGRDPVKAIRESVTSLKGTDRD